MDSAHGVPWRDLPERYGPWQTVFIRFRIYRFKPYRGVATRNDQLGDLYLAVVAITAILLWL